MNILTCPKKNRSFVYRNVFFCLAICIVAIQSMFVSLSFADVAACKKIYSAEDKSFKEEAESKIKALTNKNNLSRIRTEKLVDYLKILLQEQFLTKEQLQLMLTGLEKNQFVNPVGPNEISRSFVQRIIAEGIQGEINSGQLSVAQLAMALRHLVEEEQKMIERKEEVHNITENIFVPARFVTVSPGSFFMGRPQFSKFTQISISFEMMSIPMTQIVFARLMLFFGAVDLAVITPSYFKDRENSVTLVGIDNSAKLLKIQPDNPVESVSYDFIVRDFLPKLNDLSNLDDREIQNYIKDIFPGHQKGDHYDLPTEAQVEYVMKKAKTKDGDSIDGMIKRRAFEKLKQYAVYRVDSVIDANSGTKPVHQQLPLFVEGQQISMHGNVFEWVKDAWDGDAKFPGGKDPLVVEGHLRIVRGGSWSLPKYYMLSSKRHANTPSNSGGGTGFRLIRTRNSQQGNKP